jgi:HEAT repeat protein
VRSPYLLVDEPGEVVEIDGDLAHWPTALRALHSASGRPAELAALYASWLEHDSAELRRAALIGLGEPGSTLSPPESSGERLAELAVDPELGSPLRLRAASGALRTDGGRRALLEALPGGAGADARVLTTGVQAALRGGGDARAVLMRSLDHESPEIRRTGARLCALIAQDEELRERLGELARSDPDAGVRQAAMRAMGVG